MNFVFSFCMKLTWLQQRDFKMMLKLTQMRGIGDFCIAKKEYTRMLAFKDNSSFLNIYKYYLILYQYY